MPPLPGRVPAKSPSLAVPAQVTGAAAWAEVLNESFKTSEDLNDSFKTFGSRCGGRGGPCRGGGDTLTWLRRVRWSRMSHWGLLASRMSHSRRPDRGRVDWDPLHGSGEARGRTPGRPADSPRRSQGGDPGSSLSAATDRTGSSGSRRPSCPQSVSAVDNPSRSGHSGVTAGTVRDIRRHFGRPAPANPPENPPKVVSCKPDDHPGYTSRRACDS
jgi:hypothetical protein